VVSEDWGVRYNNRLLQRNGKAGTGRRPRVACWCGRTKPEKWPFTIAISVWASASCGPLQRWARDGALPLPPRALLQNQIATLLQLRIILGDKAGSS
jgi:hypothetical protein